MTRNREVDAESRIAEIYESYAADITTYFLRRCPPNDAADAVGETFLVAWRRLEAVPGEPDTLPWLYGVARNVLANQRRGTLRQTKLGDRLATQVSSFEPNSPASSYEAADEFRQVREALEQLPPEDAELLRMAAWEDLTPAEIADVMGISPGNVRQRLFRARRRLRRQLSLADSDATVSGRSLSEVSSDDR